jgi:acyl-CoA synthetase (AMP-forming)/AMP-acid ligase II
MASFGFFTELSGTGPGAHVWVPGPPRATMNLFALVHADHVGARVVSDPTTATHAVLTPALLSAALEDGRLTAGVTAVVAGDRLSPNAWAQARRRGLTVHHYYGAAELSFVAWGRHREDLRLFPGVAARTSAGELWVRSPYLAEGYVGPGGSLRRDPDGFVTVGDRGRLDGRRLVVDGRPAAVTTSGATVLVADVEGVLVPAARGEVVVLAVPHEHHGQVVAVVLTAPEDHRPLVAAARDRLTAVARPRLWLLCEQLPLTTGGKIDRPELGRRAAAGELPRLT